MKALLVDYSEAYYSGRHEKSPDNITGKFIQIRHNETEYLVLSPKEFAQYHANLAERFCRDRGLKGAYRGEEKRYDINERGWSIIGGGKFEMDTKNKVMRLFDNSMAYGRFDSKGLVDKIRSIKKFSDYQMMIY